MGGHTAESMTALNDGYIELGSVRGSMLVSRAAVELLRSVDSFAFDCDGTLLNSEESYVRATFETARTLFERLHGRGIETGKQGRRILSWLRQTGEYNNDWDSTFALVCFTSMAEAELDGAGGSKLPAALMDRAGDIASEFISSADRKDAASLKEFMKRRYASLAKKDEFDRISGFLNYPGGPERSPVSNVYMKFYLGKNPDDGWDGNYRPLDYGNGLISKERPLVDARTMSQIISLSGGRKPAILTGSWRSTVSASLGHLAQYFDMGASMFIGDMENEGSPDVAHFRKPSDRGLLRAIELIGSDCLLYTGDSGEDMIMVSAARKKGARVLFAGVTDNTPDPEEFRKYFIEKGADAVLHSASQIPELMNELGRIS